MSDLVGDTKQGPARLRELVAAPAPLLLPGCYDPLGARIISQADFDAVYMTGFGTAAGRLGRPDIGLLDMSEMLDNARRIVQAVDLPVLADIDTGYGNAVNVARTVTEFERAGVSGVHLEDQIHPKRCGHMDGKAVVPVDEMVAKLRAAIDARADEDFFIIARTDARAVESLEATVARAEAYRDAGADALFIEALQTTDEIHHVAERFSDTPLLHNWVEGGRSPELSFDDLAALGFAMILMPVTLLLAATTAMRDAAAALRISGTPADIAGRHLSFDEFNHFIGLPEMKALDDRYGPQRD